jgi:hypothetical protein
MTVAVESRPEDPHSVTTLCFIHEGKLYIPAQSGSSKKWTQYVSDNSLVRIKMGDVVYPVRATRILDFGFEDIKTSAGGKYTQIAEAEPGEGPQDVWLFMISER